MRRGNQARLPAQVLVTSVPLTKPSDCLQAICCPAPKPACRNGQKRPSGKAAFETLAPPALTPETLWFTGEQFSGVPSGQGWHPEALRNIRDFSRNLSSFTANVQKQNPPPSPTHTVQIAASVKTGGATAKGCWGPCWGCRLLGISGITGSWDTTFSPGTHCPLSPFRTKYGPFASPGRALTLLGQPSCPC